MGPVIPYLGKDDGVKADDTTTSDKPREIKENVGWFFRGLVRCRAEKRGRRSGADGRNDKPIDSAKMEAKYVVLATKLKMNRPAATPSQWVCVFLNTCGTRAKTTCKSERYRREMELLLTVEKGRCPANHLRLPYPAFLSMRRIRIAQRSAHHTHRQYKGCYRYRLHPRHRRGR